MTIDNVSMMYRHPERDNIVQYSNFELQNKNEEKKTKLKTSQK